MNATDSLHDHTGASPHAIERALEESEIVFFRNCPIELPAKKDLDFLRRELPLQTKIKNISFHPESDSIPRFDAPRATQDRVTEILRAHSKTVAEYLEEMLPNLARGWTIGTCSFRPLEEKGRNLKPRSSNEIVHVDAGAYGATCGGRILRFFVNVSDEADRVWATKGSFAELFARHRELFDAARADSDRVLVRKRLRDHFFSGVIGAISKAYPLAKVIDSSPYDRAMRRVHNYMKEADEFRGDLTHYRELRFPPWSAWMVFTDGVSHAVLSGRYALVTTILLPLANCQSKELSPYHILEAAR